MAHAPQIKIPATYMRGGTSKGVFFRLQDLPEQARVPGAARDALLLRVIGSPDPYGKQTDGMGGATSSTSKTVILAPSTRADHDVDYMFGQVSIDKAFVDWSGNCGNLTAAVGSFAISNGLVAADRIPKDGICTVRIWQVQIQKTIIAHVPISNGAVQETGDFELDGVTFPAAEVQIEFLDPADEGDGDGGGSMFPTGNLVDDLEDDKRAAVLAAMPETERAAIESSLAYEDETAGRLMQREVVWAPQFWTVGQTIDHFRREAEDLPELFFDVYVVDPSHRPVGAVPVSHLLRSRRDAPLAQIMEPVSEIPVLMDQEEVAYIFDKYHLISAPVVEPGGRLVGQITVDDIIGVIQEESEEDILALAGVSDAGRDAGHAARLVPGWQLRWMKGARFGVRRIAQAACRRRVASPSKAATASMTAGN